MDTPSKPMLIYDGDCGFCRRWIKRWRETTGDRVDYFPFQEVASRFPEIPLQSFKASVQFVTPDRKIYSAAEAVFRALATVPRYRWTLLAYQSIPGIKGVSEWFYRLVAKNRKKSCRKLVDA